MRLLGKMVLTLAGVTLLAGPAVAQPRPQRGGGPTSILMLLQNKAVQKELGLEEEDVAKIPDAVMDALAKTLKPEQLKRLKQIELQRRGNRALSDPKVQTALKFTDEQKQQLDTIRKDAAKTMRELRPAQGGRGGGGNANREETRKKVAELNKETTKKIDDVLTADQKKQWKAMLGQPFKFEQPRRGGRGRGGRNRQDQ